MLNYRIYLDLHPPKILGIKLSKNRMEVQYSVSGKDYIPQNANIYAVCKNAHTSEINKYPMKHTRNNSWDTSTKSLKILIECNTLYRVFSTLECENLCTKSLSKEFRAGKYNCRLRILS